MATTTTTGPGRVSVDRDGEKYSGFTTGIPTNSFTIRKLAGRARENGWIVSSGERSPWKPLGLVEHAGSMYVFGPPADGIFLDEALRDESRDRLADLASVAAALTVLQEGEVPIQPAHTRSMVLLNHGGVLFLPPDVVQAIRDHQNITTQLHTVELFSHPDRDPESNVGFFLATLAYHVLTGRFPYEAETAEDLHARIRGARPVDPGVHRYTLDPEVRAALMGTLSNTNYEPDPGVWSDRFLSWRERSVDVDLSPEALDAVRQEAQEHIQRLDRTFRRRESVRKHWRTALIIAAIAVVVGMVPGTIIRNALRPRATAGMTAEEVVVAFYTSINALDHMTMEDAVVDGAGRAFIREVTNLYVIDRQRMSVEMRSGFVDAAQWRAAGMPALEEAVTPYGVANLELQPLAAAEGEARFRVRYERWLPNYPEEDGQLTAQRYIGYLTTDTVSLRLDREDWVIYEMTTENTEPLDPADLRGSGTDTDG